jgi:hypothetical protein
MKAQSIQTDYYEAIFNEFDFVLVKGANGAEYVTNGSKLHHSLR